MPNINKSAQKRMRQAETRRERNRALKSKGKTLYKNVLKLIEDKKDQKEIMDAYLSVASFLDKASLKGYFHKNYAARKKSRLMKKINNFLYPKKG